MDLKNLNIHLRKLEQMDNPEHLFDLRKDIYHEEMRKIPLDSIVEEDDKKAIHILAYYADELIGAIRVLPAIDSELLQNESQMEGAVWCVGRLMIKKSFRGSSLPSLLMYVMSSFLRNQECEKLVTFYPKDHHFSTKTVYQAKPLNIIRHHKFDAETDVYCQLHQFPEIEWLTYKAFSLLRSDSWRKIAIEQVAIPFLKEFVIKKISQIHNNLWFQKVRQKTLSREQYIDTLGNNLKFVQWTTKILARVASITSDRALRNHFLGHMRGEVDHDLWIEDDLNYLGADVKYYRDHKVPEPEIADFMNCQESIVSHYRSPVHYLAVPLTIEAMTAFWPPADMESLKDCVRVWGYSDPAKATKFYSSHIHSDGKAEVGHWHQTFNLLPSYISSEYDVSKMYQIASCVSSSLDRAWEKFASKKSLSL